MKTARHSAFTLIDTIVTLAVIAALLTALAVSFIKQMDVIAGEKEVATLNSMGAAFKEYVRRNRAIPDHTGWVAALSTELAWHTDQISANERNRDRIFLTDPEIQVGVNNAGLPYQQNAAGSTVTNNTGAIIRPVNTRFLIISTLGTDLPSTLVSGIGDTSGPNAFTNIWSTPEGGVPPGWTFSRPQDLKIERIDLVDLFIPITFWNSDSARVPSYTVSSGPTTFATADVAFTAAPPPPQYFIRGSELRLFAASGATGANQYAEILFTGHDFLYELGAWTTKPYLGRGSGTPYGKDLQRAADLFLRAPANPNAKFSATQQKVYNAMVDYMTAFVNWRDNVTPYVGESCPGPVANNPFTLGVSAARNTLSTETGNLISP